MNILVVKPSSLGDVVHTLPAVGLLRQCFPASHITWVVNDSLRQLVDLCPYVDRPLVFRRSRWGRLRHCPELLGFLRELRERRYDVALDFQGLLRSSMIAALSGSRRRVGFSHAREGAGLFYTERVTVPPDVRHAVEKNLTLVRAALPVTGAPPAATFAVEPVSRERARVSLERHDVRPGDVLLAVGPSARWQSKVWPAGFYAEVIDRVTKRLPSVRVWLVGAGDEAGIGRALQDACRVARPINLMGETDLGTLVELYRCTDALLANDSGPMHLAAAMGVPTVALFGSTDRTRTGPYGEDHVVFDASCNGTPCLKRECPHPPAACHSALRADAVAEAVAQACLLRRPMNDGQRAPSPHLAHHSREDSP